MASFPVSTLGCGGGTHLQESLLLYGETRQRKVAWSHKGIAYLRVCVYPQWPKLLGDLGSFPPLTIVSLALSQGLAHSRSRVSMW